MELLSKVKLLLEIFDPLHLNMHSIKTDNGSYIGKKERSNAATVPKNDLSVIV